MTDLDENEPPADPVEKKRVDDEAKKHKEMADKMAAELQEMLKKLKEDRAAATR